MKKWQIWIGVLISAIFLWLAFRGLDFEEAWQNAQNANYLWLIPSVGVYFIGVWVRTWRWDFMLRPLKHIPVARLFPVVVIGYMGNNIYPLRAGEVLRSYVLKQREDIPMGASLATVVVERVFDGLVMLMFVFAALPFAPIPGQLFQQTVIFASFAFFTALIVFFAIAAFPKRFLKIATWVTHTFLPKKVHAPLLDFTERFLNGLESLRNFRNVLMIFFTSIIIWLLETVKYWFVMQAFDFSVTFFALMLMNGIVNLATTIPTAPGYVGTFDLPGIAVLTQYGVPENIATPYTLVLHIALWLPITLLGGIYMLREGMSWSDFGKAVQMAESEARA
ncbi:MAG: lysylphosphatidylglycerol synthase transmembrane domain-containing protein [Chloroflexota bacterium]